MNAQTEKSIVLNDGVTKVGVGEPVLLNGKTVRDVLVMNITPNWVIFKDLTDNKRKDCTVDAFKKNASKPQEFSIPKNAKTPVDVEPKKFSFKKDKETGVYTIMVNKKKCGVILQTAHESKDVPVKFEIRLSVMKTEKITDSNSKRDWTSITLKNRFETADLATTWLQQNAGKLQSGELFTLKFHDND